jgi:hypothetical protein
MQQITAHDRVRIAARAIVCVRTVARVYCGEGTEYSRERVRAAAQDLGLPPPPETLGQAGGDAQLEAAR